MYKDNNTQQRNMRTTNESLESPPSATSFIVSTALETGKERAKQALNIYSHIDYIRPYFNVEPRDILNRLVKSCVPLELGYSLQNELYGPLMLIFTLSAILNYQMKLANHSVQDGTIIGTSLFVCFTYWISFSSILFYTSSLFGSSISFSNYLNLVGYSLLSNCIVLLVATFIHTTYDHYIFYILWLLLGGMAGTKMAYTIFTNTRQKQFAILFGLFTVSVHLMFLLYLHFAYHEEAEARSHALSMESQKL